MSASVSVNGYIISHDASVVGAWSEAGGLTLAVHGPAGLGAEDARQTAWGESAPEAVLDVYAPTVGLRYGAAVTAIEFAVANGEVRALFRVRCIEETTVG